MKNCILEKIDFTGANLSGATFNYCDASSSCFLGAEITSTKFVGCNLEDSDFSIVRIRKTSAGFSKPLFADSRVEGATVPSDYASYFDEFSDHQIIRDLDSIDII